jgi:hypothetical protein
MVQTFIDSSRIIGFGTFGNIVKLNYVNPELFVREPLKEDLPLSKRKQFFRDYFRNTNLS